MRAPSPTPSASSSPPSSSSSSSGRTIAIAAGVLILSVGGFLVYKKLTSASNKEKQQQLQDEKKTGTTTSISNISDKIEKEGNVYSESNATSDLSMWKVFEDKQLGIKFKYPANYDVVSLTSEFDSYVFQVVNKDDSSNVRILIQMEEQDEQISPSDYLQNAIHALSLIGSSVQKRNEKVITLPGGLEGKEVELLTTTQSPQQVVRTWVLVTTLPTKSVAVQYVSPDPQNFDTTVIKNIVRTLQVTEKQYAVSVRAHTANQKLSITLPNFRYHIRKPYISADTVLSASIISGNQISSMITITAHDGSDATQFLTNHKNSIASKTSFSALTDTVKVAHGSVAAHLFTFTERRDDIEYLTYHAVFAHHGVNFLVEARCQVKDGDAFKGDVLKAISSITFEEKKGLQEDLITYTNGTHKFAYEMPAEYYIKQHAVYPIVTFSSPPTVAQQGLKSQTQIAVRDIQSPITSLHVLRQILMSELEQPDTIMEVLSEKNVTVDGIPALEIVYKLKEPLTQQVLVFVVTAFVKDGSNVFSLKSCTLGAVYNQSAYHSFTREHSSFKFL